MSLQYAYIHARPNTIDAYGIFYVGKGKGKRYKQMTYRNRHHQSIINKHGAENILTGKIECSSEEIAFELEKGLIKCFRRMGVKLANQTDGGEGACGHTRSEELKAAMRGNQYAKGNKLSVKHREAIRKAQMGNKHTKGVKLSSEHLAKISAALKGRPGIMLGKKHSEDTKRKTSEKLKGRLLSPMTEAKKAKLSVAAKLQMTPEARKHLSDLNKGKKQNPETIAKRMKSRENIDLTKTKLAVRDAVFGSKWMNNSKERRRVLPALQEALLNSGWVFGKGVL